MGMPVVCPFKSARRHRVLIVDKTARQVSGEAHVAQCDRHHRDLIGRSQPRQFAVALVEGDK